MIRPTPALLLAVATLSLPLTTGCDNSPPPPRVPVPAQGTVGYPRYDPAKPLPGQLPQQGGYYPTQTYPQPSYPQAPASPSQPSSEYVPSPNAPAPQPVQQPMPPQAQGPYYDPRIAAPPAGQIYQPPPPAVGTYNDVPIIRDRPPEQRAFVDAYNRVGRPKIAIFMNRQLTGEIINAGDGNTGATPLPAAGGQPYIKPPDADEAWAKNLDYEAVESVLTDWLAAGGQTEIISPTLARARMTQEQRTALENGERFVLTDITQRLDADIFILAQARPTRQTNGGLSVRLVAEALNTRGGRSIGRAVVDVPPPLERTTINEYTRFLARKLMDDMISAWSQAGALPAQQATQLPPQSPSQLPQWQKQSAGNSPSVQVSPIGPTVQTPSAQPGQTPQPPQPPSPVAPPPPSNVVPPPR